MSPFDLTIAVVVVVVVVGVRPLDAQPALKISPTTPTINEPSNRRFVVTCEGVGAEPNFFEDMHWTDPNGARVDRLQESVGDRESGRQPNVFAEHVSAGVLLLHLLSPRAADNSGTWRCGATFQHTDALVASVALNFYEDLTFDDCRADQFLVAGEAEQRVRCRASANPKPIITWAKDGAPLDAERYAVDATGVRIKGVTRTTDAGKYEVRARVTDTGKFHATLIAVNVFVRPAIRAPPVPFEAVAGQPAELRCELDAGAVPTPDWSWFDPSRRNLSAVAGYHVNRETGVLIVDRVRLPDDNGSFTCVAQNSVGAAQMAVPLAVLVRPLVTRFLNHSFAVDEDALFECHVRAVPKPFIQIRKDQNSRGFVPGDPRVVITERPVDGADDEVVYALSLIRTQRSDDGLYYCSAENRAGKAESTGHLEVRYAPDLSKTETRVKTWDTRAVNITCVAESIPNATIKWWFRGQEVNPLFSGDLYRIESAFGQSVLHINGVQSRDIYGAYKCEAFNALGRRELTIELERAYPPAAITSVTADRIGATTIAFRLIGPLSDGGLRVKSIHVQFREDERPWDFASALWTRTWPLATDPTGGQPHGPYVLDRLRPNTRYAFRFGARNEAGVGDYSLDKVFTTAREARPDLPRVHNLPVADRVTGEVTAPQTDSVTLAWTAEDNGRAVTFYTVTWAVVERTEAGLHEREQRRQARATTAAYTLTGLRARTLYRIGVTATNDLGTSDETVIVVRTADRDDGVAGDTPVSDAPPSGVASFAGLLVLGVVVVLAVVLVVTDVCFYVTRKVGVTYFLVSNVCVNQYERETRDTGRCDTRSASFDKSKTTSDGKQEQRLMTSQTIV